MDSAEGEKLRIKGLKCSDLDRPRPWDELGRFCRSSSERITYKLGWIGASQSIFLKYLHSNGLRLGRIGTVWIGGDKDFFRNEGDIPADVLPPSVEFGANMKTAMEMAEFAAEQVVKNAYAVAHARANPVSVRKIENLPEETLDDVMDWAQKEGVDTIREKLRDKGFIVGRSTLSRYLRARKQEEAAEGRKELAAAAKELTTNREGGVWRIGAMEAIREKLFEEALGGGPREERLKVYQALVAEEERLRKLALEEERARMQREGLELQRERLQIEAAKTGSKFFLEALKVLRDEKIAAELKVERALAQLERWKGEAIEVGEVKAIEEKV